MKKTRRTDKVHVATKDYLQMPATKADIERLEKRVATKTELKRVEKSLRQEVLKVEERVKHIGERVENIGERVENIEERVKHIGESQERVEVKLDRIAITLDGFVGRVDNLTADNEVGAHHTRELRVQVDNHEKRITKLESATRPTHQT